MNVPAHRIAELLQPLVDKDGITAVSETLGCNHRIVADVLSGGRQYLSPVTVDKWCTRLERTDWLHVELADIYNRDEDVEKLRDELAAERRRAKNAEQRARKWYREVKRLRQSRLMWKERHAALQRETEPWRQAERYRARTAAKKAA